MLSRLGAARSTRIRSRPSSVATKKTTATASDRDAAPTKKKNKTRPVWKRVAVDSAGPRVSGAVGFPAPGGGFLLFGGYLEDERGAKRVATSDTWRLDASLSTWEKVDAPVSPRQRLAAAGAVASSPPHAWLLGGWDPGREGDGGEILSDVWRFDFDESEWSEAELSVDAGGEGDGGGASAAPAASPAAAPAPSDLPAAPETTVAMPPGREGGASAFSSVASAAADGAPPLPESIVVPRLPACSRAAAAAIPSSGNGSESTTIALFTHRNGEDLLLLDVLDPRKPSLRACVVAGDAGASPQERAYDGSTRFPASRGLTALVAVDREGGDGESSPSSTSHLLHLFGGAPKSGPMLDDSWLVEMSRGWEGAVRGVGRGREEDKRGPLLRWSRQRSSPSPPPRCSHAVGVLGGGDSLYLFGGAYYDPVGLLPLGDLWRLDLKTLEWEEVESGGASPSPRNASAFGVVELREGGESKRGLLVHGGWDPFRKTYDDTWLLTEEEEE